MSFDLKSRNGSFSLNNQGWKCILRTALDNGWKPKGITQCWEYPEDIEPETIFLAERKKFAATDDINDYFTNDFQIVDEDDAQELKEAIVRAVQKLSLIDDIRAKEDIDFFNKFIDFCQEEFYIY